MFIAMGVMAAMSVLGSIMGSKAQNAAAAAQETANRKAKLQMVRQANMQDANLRLQDKSNFEAARLELENQTLSAIKAQSTVRTAMAESNLEGRTMERVQRDVENVHLRTKGMINENYERDYHNIYVQREDVRNQLIGSLEGVGSVQRQSSLSQGISAVGAGIQGAMVGANLWGTLTQDPTVEKAATKKTPQAK